MIKMAVFPAIILFSYMTASEADFPLPQDEYAIQRARMVREQIKSRGIKDERVLSAFQKVERHLFVLPDYRKAAYGDFPLPIEEGQTISQPYIVAFMTDILNLKKTDRVLEIGTGSGYQAAILAQLCDTVYTVEIFDSLVKKAQKLFADLGYNNIMVKSGDGYQGWEEHAPYNAILVTCAPAVVPEPLIRQLAEGGRIIIPVGQSPFQELVLLKKKDGKVTRDRVLSVRFVPMINEKGKSY
jgi:protein-L-isoaspartate(D-aspartate) O-methyltransferase